MKSSRHKVLHEIAGRPMIEHLLASVAELEPERLVIIVGEWSRTAGGTAGRPRAHFAVQEPQLGTGHAVQQAEEALAGFEGDVLVLYGDVPFVQAGTMRAMIDRLRADDAPAAVVLGFEPDDPLRYGRVIAQQGRIIKMVEYKDASEEERACTLCNSGLLAARSEDLFALLARVGERQCARRILPARYRQHRHCRWPQLRGCGLRRRRRGGRHQQPRRTGRSRGALAGRRAAKRRWTRAPPCARPKPCFSARTRSSAAT